MRTGGLWLSGVAFSLNDHEDENRHADSEQSFDDHARDLGNSEERIALAFIFAHVLSPR